MLVEIGQVLKKVPLKDLSWRLYSELAPYYNHTVSYRKYQSAYFGGAEDHSFALFSKEKIVAVVYITVYQDSPLCYFDGPIGAIYSEDLSFEEKNRVAQGIKQEIAKIAMDSSSKEVLVTSDLHLAGCFYEPGGELSAFVHALVPLKNSEEILFQGVRKSYRSLLNWGRKTVKEVIVDKENPDRALFDSFKNLHIRVAGRQTRSDVTWDLQFQGILNGEVYLVLGYLGDELVSGVLNFIGADNAYYAVAVNDRDLMSEKKPLGHWMVMRSILYAKENGCSRYDLGNVSSGIDIKKNLDIAIFKKGFTQNLEIRNQVKCRLD